MADKPAPAPYQYVEYPKCLYNSDGSTMTVDNGEEEADAKQMGWKTAEEYHKKPEKKPHIIPGHEAVQL